VEEGTAEVEAVEGALLAMMPDPVSIKKRTGFGTHILPWLGPGLVSQDCEAECLETNNSEAPAAVIPFSMSKKRTGFGTHLYSQIRGISQGLRGHVRRSEILASAEGIDLFRFSGYLVPCGSSGDIVACFRLEAGCLNNRPQVFSARLKHKRPIRGKYRGCDRCVHRSGLIHSGSRCGSASPLL